MKTLFVALLLVSSSTLAQTFYTPDGDGSYTGLDYDSGSIIYVEPNRNTGGYDTYDYDTGDTESIRPSYNGGFEVDRNRYGGYGDDRGY